MPVYRELSVSSRRGLFISINVQKQVPAATEGSRLGPSKRVPLSLLMLESFALVPIHDVFLLEDRRYPPPPIASLALLAEGVRPSLCFLTAMPWFASPSAFGL